MGVTKATNVYVASSWKNIYHVAVCAALKSAGISRYDFKQDGFSWDQVSADWNSFDGYTSGLQTLIAQECFKRDFEAMEAASHFVLVLPSGRSAHLEAGWAIAMGKPTAIYIPDYDGPDLMYLMADFITDSMFDLLGWLGVED
jgi:nucleoside 2-deoxyribosyltransferase